MKAILISIRPKWIAKILNGEKTIEIRKTAPKCDFPIDVYIYCTKSAPYLHPWMEPVFTDPGEPRGIGRGVWKIEWHIDKTKWYMSRNGKVVAKFTLNGIDKFTEGLSEFEFEHLTPGEIARSGRPYYKKALERACLTDEELRRYAPDKSFYAWYIEELVIFDGPMDLAEVDYPNPSGTRYVGQRSLNGLPSKKHPPQSWCYVEVGE